MSKSAKRMKNDKVKIKPRRSFVNEIVEEETDRVIVSLLKQKNDLKNFEEFIEEK